MQLIVILTSLKYVYCTRDCCFDTVKVGVLHMAVVLTPLRYVFCTCGCCIDFYRGRLCAFK